MKETIHLLIVIGVEDSGTLTWNIDASFVVHLDCKSHTGACLTLGYGRVLSISVKQKINTKSSTDAERVNVDDAIVMWMKRFFGLQVSFIDMNYSLKTLGSGVTIEQDNTRAIQLDSNR